MLKGNRFLAIIALFFLVVSMGSCGGGRGGGGGGDTSGGGGGVPENFTLIVDKFGGGIIVSDQSGINCGDDCSESYPSGTTVVLTATPSSGYEFKSFAGCDEVRGNTCIVTMNRNRTVLPTFASSTLEYQPYFKILDDNIMQDFVRQDGDIYYFNLREDSPVLNLQPGDIIATTVGEGFLRRVEVISISGNLIEVETLSATLEDAIKQGTIAFNKKLTHGDLQSSKALAKGVILQRAAAPSAEFNLSINIICDENGNCTDSRNGDFIKMSGSIKLTFEPDIAIDIGLFEGVKEFKFALITNSTNNMSVEISRDIEVIDKKIPLSTFYFSPIIVGPVVIVPQATVYAGIKGDTNATLDTGITMTTEYTVGVHYKKERGWSPISSYWRDLDWNEPTLTGSVSLKGFVGPEFLTKIYGVAGPMISAEGFLKALGGISIPSPSIWWKLYGGIDVSTGAKVDILGWALAEYTFTLTLFEAELASGNINLIVDITPPSIPTGVTGFATSATQINLSWNESTDDIGVAGYKIYRDGNYIKSVYSTSASDTGLNPNTQYCYRISAYDNNSNESYKSDELCITTHPLSDTISPAAPQLLSVTAISSSQIDLNWSHSTDNVGVIGYKIYRNGVPIRALNTTSFSDEGLSPSTTYCYNISAFDAAGNESELSNQICETTPGGGVITGGDSLYITLLWSGGDTSDMDLHLNYYETTNPTSTTPITWYVDWHIGRGCNNPSNISYSDALDLDNDGICDIGLDWDDTEGYGPEHITATTLPAGYYVISVNSYSLDMDPYADVSVAVKIGDSLFGPYEHTFTTSDGEGQNPHAWFRVIDLRVNTDGTVEIISPNPDLKPWHSATIGSLRRVKSK